MFVPGTIDVTTGGFDKSVVVGGRFSISIKRK
jgi:hypothetical protein